MSDVSEPSDQPTEAADVQPDEHEGDTLLADQTVTDAAAETAEAPVTSDQPNAEDPNAWTYGTPTNADSNPASDQEN